MESLGVTAAPEVSVIIPVHDRAELLRRALTSVALQVGAPALEVIVVDDASNDGSAAVARDLGATVVVLAVNQGPSAARNAGIAAARGRWVAFLDSDDLWGPSHLATVWAARQGVAMVSASTLNLMDEDRRRDSVGGSPFAWTVGTRRPSDVVRPECIVHPSTVLIRARVVEEAGGFVGRYSEDLDLWMRVLRRERGRVLADITVVAGCHAGQVTNRYPAEMATSYERVLAAAEARSELPARVRARITATTWWDEGRTGGGRPSLAGAARRSADLLPVLLGRLSRRHRWRLPGSGTAEVRACYHRIMDS